MKVLFLDESGDHDLAKIDSQFPVFVLGGAICDVRYAKEIFEDVVSRFKLRHFGREDIILHTADIVRNRNGFEILKNRDVREAFFADLNILMRRLDYKVVACAIRKREYADRYGNAARDPYEQCLRVLVERFCYEIGGYGDRGWIVAECRGRELDAKLLLAWDELRQNGTDFVSGADIRERIRGLAYREKERNIAGLQIADLAVTPIGRHLIGKPTREDFEIIESKLRRLDDDDYMGPGLVILP